MLDRLGRSDNVNIKYHQVTLVCSPSRPNKPSRASLSELTKQNGSLMEYHQAPKSLPRPTVTHKEGPLASTFRMKLIRTRLLLRSQSHLTSANGSCKLLAGRKPQRDGSDSIREFPSHRPSLRSCLPCSSPEKNGPACPSTWQTSLTAAFFLWDTRATRAPRPRLAGPTDPDVPPRQVRWKKFRREATAERIRTVPCSAGWPSSRTRSTGTPSAPWRERPVQTGMTTALAAAPA